MARVILLEVLDASGAVRARTRLDAFPATVGRAYSNDLILDDPYVDPHHLRIAEDERGELVATDLGSVNGLRERARPGGPRDGSARVASVPLHGGTELRVGRTVLRVRDPEQPVAPALRDGAGTTPDARLVAWLARPRVAVAVCAATVAALALHDYLGSYARVTAAKVTSGAVAILAALALWAGAWALANRIVSHRFNFVAHLALACAVMAAGLVLSVSQEWLAFLLPDSGAGEMLQLAAGVALAAGLLAGHLSLASSMSRRRRWTTALGVVGVLVGMAALSSYADRDEYSSRMNYSGTLKPVPPTWVHTVSLDDFAKGATELKAEVDGMAKK